MDFDLFSCTFEKLNNLKFNELRKFSSQFQVNKRWAKKREIIDTILTLRDQEMKKRSRCEMDAEKNIKGNENFEWISGEQIFSSNEIEKSFDCDENTRRLTYSVTDPVFTRLTFSISKTKEKNVILPNENIEMLENIDRRFTYNANDLKYSLNFEKKKIDSSEITKKASESVKIVENSFQYIKDISQINSLKDKTKNNKTCLNLKRDSYKDHYVATDMKNETEEKCKVNEKNASTKEHIESQSSNIKMLTIPYSRVLRQNGKNLIKESNTSTLKISEKSIKRRKSNNKLNEFIKSPHQTPRISKLKINEEFISISSKKKMEEMLFTENTSANKQNLKYNMPHVLHENNKMANDKQIQKKKDCILKDLKSNIELNPLKCLLPKESNFKYSKMSTEPLYKSDGKMNSKSNIPRAKSSLTTSKIITATKMPDFSKIHKKRFEQMDSLHDYQRKKKERVEKLFGIPQPGIPVKMTKTAENNIFHFKSSHKKLENQTKMEITSVKSTSITSEKEKEKKKQVRRLGGSESDIVKTLKEENRKHLHGVRTNKRFELQMKYRNL